MTIKKASKKKKERKNERSSLVLSHITKLLEVKTKQIKSNTYIEKDNKRPRGVNSIDPVFYNLHDYLDFVCTNLRDLVATIMDNKPECVDVSLIYNYANEPEWKWITGRSGSSQARTLTDLVNDTHSFFSYIINDTKQQYVFCNDKKELADKHYTWGRRDELSEHKGSIMGWKLTAFNNERALVNAVLVISTYGATFVETNSTSKKKKEFETILLSEIIPYYISIIQPELCLMYLRHEKNSTVE